MATAAAWCGTACPVYADDPTTNLDAAAAERAITLNTSAIVAVHNFGNPADIAELEDVARRHKLADSTPPTVSARAGQ